MHAAASQARRLNRRADSNALHEHVDQDWAFSGIAYLSDGGDASCAARFARPWPGGDGGGGVELGDAAAGRAAPARGDGGGAADEAVCGVEEGTLLLFPAWLQHWVPPPPTRSPDARHASCEPRSAPARPLCPPRSAPTRTLLPTVPPAAQVPPHA